MPKNLPKLGRGPAQDLPILTLPNFPPGDPHYQTAPEPFHLYHRHHVRRFAAHLSSLVIGLN